MISQVDMEDEKRILQNMKKHEFMNDEQAQNILEVNANDDSQNVAGESINQTYKMIMSNQNMNHNDFSIEDASDEGEEDEEEGEGEEAEEKETYEDNYFSNVNIEPIVEEDGEESKYMPTPQKPVTSKMEGNKAIECVKALKAKEIEKRLEIEEDKSKIEKNFKSADAQKPKATMKDNKNVPNKDLPPKIPNRSLTSNENPKGGIVPNSYLRNYNKAVPSTTKASSAAETPKSLPNGQVKKQAPPKKNSLNDSRNSSDGDRANPESCRALMLYETPTVASKQKKQGAFKQEETLPPWGIQSVNTKHVVGKRVTSATTRSTVTPRANNLKRGNSSSN